MGPTTALEHSQAPQLALAETPARRFDLSGIFLITVNVIVVVVKVNIY